MPLQLFWAAQLPESNLGFCWTGDHYFIFDCPGQVELMTLHNSFQTLIQTLVNKWSYR